MYINNELKVLCKQIGNMEGNEFDTSAVKPNIKKAVNDEIMSHSTDYKTPMEMAAAIISVTTTRHKELKKNGRDLMKAI